MFGISFLELMVIGLLVLVVLGPEKLPEVARWAGKGMRELRQMSNTLRDALMIDDLSGTSRSSARNLPSAKKPLPAAAADKLPTETAGDAPAMNEPYPSAYSETPLGLDQIGDAQFDEILAQQYRLHHHTNLVKIPLKPLAATSDTVTIALRDVDGSGKKTQSVLLARSLSLELAS